MQINYGESVCSNCGGHEIKKGHKKYTEDGRWVGKEYLKQNPNTKLANTYPAVWIDDETNISCVNCKYELNEDEIKNLPKLGPIKNIETKIGLGVFNPRSLEKLNIKT